MPDEAVIRQLTAIKGIGEWTTEMLLSFSLGRLDIFRRATAVGLVGGQKIDYCQNRTLYESNYNGVEVHLFEGSYLAKF